MDRASEPQGFDYVGMCIRPPSEADSILIQATLGCSHHKCTFCGSYGDQRFAIKPRPAGRAGQRTRRVAALDEPTPWGYGDLVSVSYRCR